MSDYWFQQRYDDAYFARYGRMPGGPPQVALDNGHDLESDPGGMSSVDRWTCKNCGRAVLTNGPVIYGAASAEPCDASKEDL